MDVRKEISTELRTIDAKLRNKVSRKDLGRTVHESDIKSSKLGFVPLRFHNANNLSLYQAPT